MPARTLAAAPAFVLPVMFLGYAIVANYEFVSGVGRDIAEMPKTVSAYLNGDAAVKIDDYYKKIMPHRLPSIDAMGVARYALFHEGRRGVIAGKDGWLFSREEYEAPIRRTADLAEAAKGIAEVRQQLADKGINLVVVPLPAKLDIYREHSGDTVIADDLDKLYVDFLALLDREGVRSVDTRPALLAAKSEGQLFLSTDTHWTPLGAGTVAQAVGKDLGVRDPQAFELNDAAPAEREGDLSKFVVTGGLASLVGLGPEAVTPREAVALTASPESDIFGPSSIPYTLVGTSYSANALWSFAESLKAALGADVLNVAEEGKGPIAPMRTLLKSATLTESPPETVIWEFPIRYLGQPQLWSEETPKEAAK